ncbi:unnamed protein product [Medioppia subpectinata]|uniref:RING-type domain-containing protein n=1 Tax=Medioppia subpectinata TaxID=1979941 RepID=A0A7R9Q4F7_9ACAR|nr:unnamed protein product [Medioppia subpectinata]CAG2112239.1 unnamed protein product [Medioppia subpectinata]
MLNTKSDPMVGFSCDRFVNVSGDESLSVLTELKCGICLNVLNNAVVTQGGHSFCYQCLDRWLSRPDVGVKDCPECREALATKKRIRKRTRGDQSLPLMAGEDVPVIKCRRLNAVIGKLRIKCQYEWNGCHEVCPLESLSAHHTQCEHRLCRACGLAAGVSADEHNCIELLVNDRKELKDRLEAVVKEKDDMNTKLIEMETKNKLLTHKLSADSHKFGPKLSVEYLIFGKYRTTGHSIIMTSDGIKLCNVEPNNSMTFKYHIMLPFVEMQNLAICADHSLPLLVIKPVRESALKIMDCLSLSNGLFDINSNDKSLNTIVIVLQRQLNELLTAIHLKTCELRIRKNGLSIHSMA